MTPASDRAKLRRGRTNSVRVIYRRANLRRREVGIDALYLLDTVSSRHMIADDFDRNTGAGDTRLPGANSRVRGNVLSHPRNPQNGYGRLRWSATASQVPGILTASRRASKEME